MKKVNTEMEKMWKNAQPKSYARFRTFIFEIKDQSFFPNGVYMEGVQDGPVNFRGETGANDTLIPTMDNLMGLYDRFPSNPLTETLKDFRKYRPKHHDRWLDYVLERSRSAKVRDFALEDSNSACKYLGVLD